MQLPTMGLNVNIDQLNAISSFALYKRTDKVTAKSRKKTPIPRLEPMFKQITLDDQTQQ